MARSIITFDIADGRRQDFLDAFRRISVLEISSFQAGYEGGQLLASVNDPRVAAVVADWHTPASYDGWLANPERERTGRLLADFLTQTPVGQIFQVVHSVPPRTSR